VAFLIDIEGIDGSGKGTQASLLTKFLRDRGYSVELLSFPRYGKTTFAHGIADFLNGRFGSLDQVDPFLVSLLYAGDRLESRDWILELSMNHDVLVLDRYVPSNMAHQGSKRTGAEREELLQWINKIEYEIYQLPRPDLVLWLDLPVHLAHERIAAKKPRNYTEATTDLQESDLNHLAQTRQVYEFLAENQPNWHAIPTVEHERQFNIEEISRRISEIVLDKLSRK